MRLRLARAARAVHARAHPPCLCPVLQAFPELALGGPCGEHWEDGVHLDSVREVK
jgi:hypothetical protein